MYVEVSSDGDTDVRAMVERTPGIPRKESVRTNTPLSNAIKSTDIDFFGSLGSGKFTFRLVLSCTRQPRRVQVQRFLTLVLNF